MSGGGGSQNVTQTNMPAYAKPYYQELLKQTGLNIFETTPIVKDPKTGKVISGGQVTGIKGYEPYAGGDVNARVAGFSDLQKQAQNETAGLQTPGQFAAATQGANAGMNMGLGAAAQGLQQALGYRPGQFNVNQVQSPELNYFQMNQPQNVRGQRLQNFSMQGAQGSYNPDLQNYQMQGPKDVEAQQLQNFSMGAAKTDYNPNLQTFQMQRPEDVRAQQLQNFSMQGAKDNTDYMAQLEKYQMAAPQQVAAERASASEFGGADASKYMSPFQQQVSDIAAREVQRRADIDKSQGAMSSIGRGTFGGSRQALLQAEADRNTQQQIGDIYAKGQQAAYENAQSQFERDQARRMASQQLNVQSGLQAGLANQQAGLTAGQANLNALLGVQSLGTTSNLQNRLANLSNEQQAGVQNLASQLQTQGLSSQQALQAALANQQAGLTAGQQNLSSQLQTQQLGTQTGLQTALANLSSEQQANVQNLASQLQTQGLSADQALKAAMSNQQAGLTTGQQNLSANLQTQQLGTQTGLQMALANLSNEQQANVQNLASQLQTQGLSADQALKAALANQQSALTTGQQNLQASLGVQGLAANQNLQAQLANQQYGLEGQKLSEQAKQYAAGLGKDVGLAGLQQGLSGSELMGKLGASEQASDLARLEAQNKAGAAQQGLSQQQLDTLYQQAMEARDWDKSQLQFYSDILRGNAGALGSKQVSYTNTNPYAQAAGLGIAGLGALTRT